MGPPIPEAGNRAGAFQPRAGSCQISSSRELRNAGGDAVGGLVVVAGAERAGELVVVPASTRGRGGGENGLVSHGGRRVLGGLLDVAIVEVAVAVGVDQHGPTTAEKVGVGVRTSLVELDL